MTTSVKVNGEQTNGTGCKGIKKQNENGDSMPKVLNPHLASMDHDYLYHLALGTGTHDLQQMFGDVKFVCMGGTAHRMKMFANYIMDEIGYELPTGTTLKDITANSHRYSMYKVGPVLAVNHGMGTPSLSILLHELIKLMYYAKVKDPIFFRIGTSGGIGLEPGTVVVSSDACDEMMRHYITMPVCGKEEIRPTKFDEELVQELLSLTKPDDHFHTVCGTTMCANDFYEAQGRLDGAFCEYTIKEKREYLDKLHKHGVRNIEMESVMLSSMTYKAKIKAADICVTLVNRLEGDQVTTPKEILYEWQLRPFILVARYIKKHLNIKS